VLAGHSSRASGVGEAGQAATLIGSIYARISPWFRTKRMHECISACGISTTTKVLDVGGSDWNWSFVDVRPRLTIVNLHPPPTDDGRRRPWIVADGRSLPFPDGAFDFAYSNSGIEH
jgi:hypothetical protein